MDDSPASLSPEAAVAALGEARAEAAAAVRVFCFFCATNALPLFFNLAHSVLKTSPQPTPPAAAAAFPFQARWCKAVQAESAALAQHQAQLEKELVELQGWLAEAQAEAVSAKAEAAAAQADAGRLQLSQVQRQVFSLEFHLAC